MNIKLMLILLLVSVNTLSFELGLGQGTNHVSEYAFSEVSINYLGYDFGVGGMSNDVEFASVTKTFDVTNGLFVRVGIARVHNSDIVGPWNYRSGIGYRRNIFSVEFSVEFNHFSSSGLYYPNNGIDAIYVRVKL